MREERAERGMQEVEGDAEMPVAKDVTDSDVHRLAFELKAVIDAVFEL